MTYQNPLHALMDGRLALFQEFLKHPSKIGSVISSSRFLEYRVVKTARIRSAKTIVELGPGTGRTTRAILKAMARHTKLLSIERNPHLHTLVKRIEDDRLIVHHGDANGLKKILSMYGLDAPEALISGIPFSTMSFGSGSQIIEAISSVLAPGGRFVAYQVSKRVAVLSRPILGPGQMEVELLNIPPLRVYRWEKNSA
jgi:phosphatidylethanolamine/phosphatidyl-N-methylethanolamine N-methyltransferase